MKKKKKYLHMRLSDDDQLKLLELTSTYDINKTDLIRLLIRSYYDLFFEIKKNVLTDRDNKN